MAHEIVFDDVRGINPIAFVGETPWHGLGQQLSPDATMDEWCVSAGMDFDILEREVLFRSIHLDGATKNFPGRKVLVRDDDGSPLSIVSNRYKIVQPSEVLGFFTELVKAGGFKMNTAGVLFGGKRYWALAELGESACILGDDRVDGYLLLGTSCDGSLATTAMFTSVRVVCNNTLGFAVQAGEDGKAKRYWKVDHSVEFDAEEAKVQLGLASSSWNSFVEDARVLAQRKVTDTEALEWTIRILGGLKAGQKYEDMAENQAKIVQKVFTLYKGNGMGSRMESSEGTAWGLVNAVTQWSDHDRRTRGRDNKLNSAWFGGAATVKQNAWTEALKLAA